MEAEFAKDLAIVRMEPVEKLPATRISKRLEHFVHVRVHDRYYATFWLHVKRNSFRAAESVK
jgi:hypothetical protein